MITERVIGVYSSVGTLPPAEQADWYRRVANEWGIRTFEIPLFAGRPLPGELVSAFAELKASLVVTLIAQWATEGQKDRAYGLASLDEVTRQRAVIDALSILQQCVVLAAEGIGIRNIVVQAGQRMGDAIPHAIAFDRSLAELRRFLPALLPGCGIAIEPADTRPSDHPVPFPASKKSALDVDALMQMLTAVNTRVAVDETEQRATGLMVNWGRLMIDGRSPLETLEQILAAGVPLTGVILSGAGSSPEGLRDSHNSHLDPQSGFTTEDARKCADLLRAAPQPIFLGMKCSRASSRGELDIEQVLSAQAELLNELA